MSEKPTESVFERTVSRRELLEKAGKVGAGALVAGSLAGPAAAATQDTSATPKKVPTGGTVTWALEDVIRATSRRSAASSRRTTTGNELMYDSLLEWDPKLNIKHALAESYDVVNSKRIVWNMQEGRQVPNGQEFTAADVKYSFDLQAESAAAGQRRDDRPGAGHRSRRRCSRSTSSRWT